MAAEQLGRAESLAVEIPECDVDAGQRRLQHRPAAPERAAEDILPDMLDAGGILTEENGPQMFEGAHNGRRPATERRLTHAVHTLIRLDLHVDEARYRKHLDVADFHAA